MSNIFVPSKTSPVPGTYQGAEVTESSIKVSGQEKAITWINKYTFYFKWSDGNEQVWIYDTARNCLFQNCNVVPAGILGTPIPRISDLIEDKCYLLEPNKLGSFKGVEVNQTFIDLGANTRNIAWINPCVFWGYWGGTNEQFWIYDPQLDGYLQMGTANSIAQVHNKKEPCVYSRVR